MTDWREKATIKAILWTGGDAPNREAKLTVTRLDYGPLHYAAYWEPGYCGCPDCHPLIGRGITEQEAIADYWEQWEDEQP